MQVTLEPVARRNVRAICELSLAEQQLDLVAPAAYTVAEGHYEPRALLLAICEGGQPVGVLLVEVESGTPHLVRFMIGAPYQGRGLGRQALALLAARLHADGWSGLEVSFVAGPAGSEGFWRSCGFVSDEPGQARLALVD